MNPKNGKNPAKEVEFVLDRLENGKAVLKYGDQELILPRRFLAKDAQEGDVLYAEFITDKMLTARRENLARAILEEILRGE